MKLYEVKVLAFSKGKTYYVDESDSNANFAFVLETSLLKEGEYVSVTSDEQEKALTREIKSTFKKYSGKTPFWFFKAS